MDFQGCLCLRKSALLIETHTLPSFANHRALYRTRVAKGKEHRAEVAVERWGLRADIGNNSPPSPVNSNLLRLKTHKFPEKRSHVPKDYFGKCELAVENVNTNSTAPTERTPSRGSANNGQPFVATMTGGGLEGCGPSQPLGSHKSTPFTARTPSRESGSNGHPFVATMIGGGLEGYGPS